MHKKKTMENCPVIIWQAAYIELSELTMESFPVFFFLKAKKYEILIIYMHKSQELLLVWAGAILKTQQ